AEAEVWPSRPVLQIVLRFAAEASEIRNFVLLQARCMQKIDRFQIKVCSQIRIRNGMSVVTGSPCDQLASEPRVFIDFEDINAGMWHPCARQLLQRVLPALSRLVGQTSNQIDIDVPNSE